MDNCGTCKHYATNPIRGPHCSRTGKAVSFLMMKDCHERQDSTPDVVTKVCNRCHRILPVTSFNRKSSTKDGYQFQCKECQAELARQLYRKRKEEQEKAAPDPEPETKVCRKCGRELPVTMFGHAPKNHNGLKSYCRDCENENCRTYRAKKRAARQKKDRERIADEKAKDTVLNTLKDVGVVSVQIQKKPSPAEQIQDVPVVNNLAERAIPVEELTFGTAIRQLLAYGSLTIQIKLSNPQK